MHLSGEEDILVDVLLLTSVCESRKCSAFSGKVNVSANTMCWVMDCNVTLVIAVLYSAGCTTSSEGVGCRSNVTEG